MPWFRDNRHGGFSDAKPWLPVAMEHLQRAVAIQESEADSMLAFYRRMIAFRKAHRVLAKGSLEFTEADTDRFAFIRDDGNQRIFCAFNLSGESIELSLPRGSWRAAENAPMGGEFDGMKLTLAPYQAHFGLGGQ